MFAAKLPNDALQFRFSGRAQNGNWKQWSGIAYFQNCHHFLSAAGVEAEEPVLGAVSDSGTWLSSTPVAHQEACRLRVNHPMILQRDVFPAVSKVNTEQIGAIQFHRLQPSAMRQGFPLYRRAGQRFLSETCTLKQLVDDRNNEVIIELSGLHFFILR